MNTKEKMIENALELASNFQISKLAYDSAIWYQSSFLQTIRLLKSEKNISISDPFSLPWKEQEILPFIAELFFFVTSLDHTLTNIKYLNIALNARGDDRLHDLSEDLLNKNNFLNRIRTLRNMHEHNVEYQIGLGNAQSNYYSVIETQLGKLSTNAHWYSHIGGEIFIGSENLSEILNHMKDFKDKLIPLLQTIQQEY